MKPETSNCEWSGAISHRAALGKGVGTSAASPPEVETWATAVCPPSVFRKYSRAPSVTIRGGENETLTLARPSFVSWVYLST